MSWASPCRRLNDLPYDDGEPMESQRHKVQMEPLIDVMEVWLEDPDRDV